MTSRYGNARIRRGLIHFFVGKGGTALAGVFAAILIVRELSIAEFAQYSVLVALVEILTALSGLGLAHALLRYVPELYQEGYQASLRKLVFSALAIRTCILGLCIVLAYIFSEKISINIGLASAVLAFQIFLITIFFRSTVQFLSQVLESTLHQGIAQLVYFVAVMTRLLGLVYLSFQGDVSLIEVIVLEIISDLLSFIVVMVGVSSVVSKNNTEGDSIEDDGSWVLLHLKKIAKFAVVGYLQHLAILPYGGHTNRLVGGNLLNVSSMANYGFAQTIYEYIKRYLPAQLLMGLIRPVIVARYCEHRNFSISAKLCEQVLQINYFFIGLLFVPLVVAGGDGLSVLSAGKYGHESLIILIGLFAVLTLETKRQQLELLVQIVEKYQFLIYSNILLASSVFAAIFFLPVWGAVAFPIANSLGLLVANQWVKFRLRKDGFEYGNTDLYPTICVIFLLLASIIVGFILKKVGVHWLISSILVMSIYILGGYVLCRKLLLDFVNDFINGKKRSAEIVKGSQIENSSINIAFSVLSSKNSAPLIDQIARNVFPHTVFVHHDFSKYKEFITSEPNIVILKDHVITSWGDWSLVEATLRLMKVAMDNPKITHFQLLSEACIPIRPINEFEAYLQNEQLDVMMDFIPLNLNHVLYSHGWRYLSTSKFIIKVARRASFWITDGGSYTPICSVNIRNPLPPNSLKKLFLSLMGKAILKALYLKWKLQWQGRDITDLAIGGQWFCLSRNACRLLLLHHQNNKEFYDYLKKCHIPDEAYIQSIFYKWKIENIPLRFSVNNHALFWDECSTGPDELKVSDLDKIRMSGKFFARKFSLDIDDPLRGLFQSKR